MWSSMHVFVVQMHIRQQRPGATNCPHFDGASRPQSLCKGVFPRNSPVDMVAEAAPGSKPRHRLIEPIEVVWAAPGGIFGFC